MLEQKTVSAGIELAQDFGPGATVVALLLVAVILALIVGFSVWVVISRMVKTEGKSVVLNTNGGVVDYDKIEDKVIKIYDTQIKMMRDEITGYRDKWHSHNQRLQDFQIELLKKVNYSVLKEEVFTRIDSISDSLLKIKVTLEKDFKERDKENDNLLKLLSKHDEKLFGENGVIQRIHDIEKKFAKR